MRSAGRANVAAASAIVRIGAGLDASSRATVSAYAVNRSIASIIARSAIKDISRDILADGSAARTAAAATVAARAAIVVVAASVDAFIRLPAIDWG